MGTGAIEVGRGIADALVDCHDSALEDIANVSFLENGKPVEVSPVDQVVLAFISRLLVAETPGQFGVVQLPRSDHQSSVLLAICAQLYARQGHRPLRGPVVLIGKDINMTNQLRFMSITGRRRMGLSTGNPLAAHRVRGDGRIEPLVGQHADDINRSLLLLNTRVGWPNLTCAAPLVIIDATSITSPSARHRAIDWVCQQGPAAVLAVCDLGDEEIASLWPAEGAVPIVLPLVEPDFAEIADSLGSKPASESRLSTMHLLGWKQKPVRLHCVPPSPVDEPLAHAWVALSAKPRGENIPELDRPFKMLRNLQRLAARLSEYRTACTTNVRGNELPTLGALDWVDVRQGNERKWRNWATAHLGPLKAALRHLHEVLEENNPKVTELWRLLVSIDRDADQGEILVRCHSRAAAMATHATLSVNTNTEAQRELWARLEDRVVFSTFKQRYPANSFAVQILVSPPQPWLLSAALSAEAEDTIVMGYGPEITLMHRMLGLWNRDAEAARANAARILGYKPAGPIGLKIAEVNKAHREETTKALQAIPDLNIANILARVAESVDAPEAPTPHQGASLGAALATGSRRCRPVHLDGQRTWWCFDDEQGISAVLVVNAAGTETCTVDALRAGDKIIVPAGDGTESVHARLVAASRSNSDVQALDVILTQFRSAAKEVAQSGTAADVRVRLEAAGAAALSQIANWKSGQTIAPREPNDVKIVFDLANRPVPDLRVVYECADGLRSLNRWLGHLVAAIATRNDDEAREKLISVVGPTAADILDEFVVAEVVSIGDAQLAPAGCAGRVQEQILRLP